MIGLNLGARSNTYKDVIEAVPFHTGSIEIKKSFRNNLNIMVLLIEKGKV